MRQIVHGKVSAGGDQLSQMLGWQGKVSQTQLEIMVIIFLSGNSRLFFLFKQKLPHSSGLFYQIIGPSASGTFIPLGSCCFS